MLKLNKDITDNILQEVSSAEGATPVILLTGPPGCGKSEVINSVNEEICKNNYVDACIKLEYNSNTVFVTDLLHFANSFVCSSHLGDDDSPLLSEIEYNYEQFNAEYNKLLADSPAVADNYTDIFKLCSFEYQRRNKVNNIKKLSDTAEHIRESTPKKSIHRLMLEPNRVSAESLIVDLMSNFYPDITSGKIDGIKPTAKIKILFVIDNCDSVSGAINDFIFHTLLEYAYNIKFNDFTSYHISFNDQSIKVADFFDFRFIYAFRSPIEKYIHKLPDEIRDKITQFNLSYMDEKDIEELITIVPSGFSVNEYLKMTGGIQKLIYSEARNLSFDIDSIPFDISSKAYNIIKGDLGENNEDMLHCLAFGYGVNEIFSNKCDEIFNFSASDINLLKYNLYLTKGYYQSGLREEYKYIIQNYLKHHIPDKYDELNRIKAATEMIPDVLEKFTDEEFNILSVMIFIPEENNLELTRLALYNKLQEVDNIYNNNKKLFPHGKYLLESKIAERIKNFIKEVDPKYYNELEAIPDKFSGRIEEEKQRIKTQKTAQILSLEKELKNIEHKYAVINKEYKKYQEELISCENSMIQIRRQINDKSYYNNLLVCMITVFITISVLIFALVLPKIFLAEGPNSPVFSVQIILYTIVFVLGILDYIFIRRAIKSYKNKGINNKYKQRLDALENEKAEYLSKMLECKEKIEQLNCRKKELQDIINS